MIYLHILMLFLSTIQPPKGLFIPVSVTEGEIIDEYGRYNSQDYILKIKSEHKTINIALVDLESTESFDIPTSISAFHSWFIAFQGDNIWIHSSDVGVVMYNNVFEAPKKYDKGTIPVDLLTEMPSSFKMELRSFYE